MATTQASKSVTVHTVEELERARDKLLVKPTAVMPSLKGIQRLRDLPEEEKSAAEESAQTADLDSCRLSNRRRRDHSPQYDWLALSCPGGFEIHHGVEVAAEKVSPTETASFSIVTSKPCT